MLAKASQPFTFRFGAELPSLGTTVAASAAFHAACRTFHQTQPAAAVVRGWPTATRRLSTQQPSLWPLRSRQERAASVIRSSASQQEPAPSAAGAARQKVRLVFTTRPRLLPSETRHDCCLQYKLEL